MNKIIALVLAGGRVGELGPLTYYQPKSAVPFGGLYRVIDFPLSNLMHSGIEIAGILSQYRSSSLIKHIGIGAAWDFVGRKRGIVMLPPFKGASAADWYNGTADAVAQNLDFIHQNDPQLVLILSGDHIYKMDYQPLIDYHLQKDADLTIVFKKVMPEESARFGMARLDDEDDETGGKVIEYFEKSTQATVPWASLTIYLFKTAALFDILKKAQKNTRLFEFGKDIIPQMLGEFKVYGYKFDGYWGYTRTLTEYWQTNMDILDTPGKIDLKNWEVRTNLANRQIRDRCPARILEHAKIKNSLFYHGCKIDGVVNHSILFPGVRVGKSAHISDSLIMFDVYISEGARIENAIIASDTVIGKGVVIGAQASEVGISASDNRALTVIGEGCRIPESMIIEQGCVIYPFRQEEHFPGQRIKAGDEIK
ncbi:glucose-1-phosphate adenylyltransferase [candidate division KSB1 bacterium]|nr:glucose-1-phosphate adenylyltransferase [candidate division KSB1 bacterium]